MGVPKWMHEYAQTTLFGESKYVYGSTFNVGRNIIRVLIGQFYEQIASELFCCKLPKQIDYWKTYPDLILWNYRKHDVLIEVKAASGCPLIDTGQLNCYKDIKESEFPFTDPEVYYMIFYYRGKNIIKKCSRIHDMLIHLGESINACYIIPIGLMLNIVSVLKPITTKWRSGTGGDFVRLPESVNKLFTYGTRKSFEDALLLLSTKTGKEISTNGYKVKKKIVKDIQVADYQVDNFPLIVVSNKKDGMLGLNKKRRKNDVK